MSVKTEIISCSNCNYSMAIHSNGINYFYLLDNGEKITARIGLGWCNRCKSIEDIHIGVFDENEICSCIKCSNYDIFKMEVIANHYPFKTDYTHNGCGGHFIVNESGVRLNFAAEERILNESLLGLDLNKQKQITIVFKELESTTESLYKEIIQLENKQGNELVEEVYSDYNNDENLINSKSKWDHKNMLHKVHVVLYEMFIKHRDRYGYFPDYENLLKDIQQKVNISISNEEYEITSIYKEWMDKLN